MSAKLTVGLNENGKKITIEDAAKGKRCNCFCPICKAPLLAKNKIPISLAKHEHHFAHLKGYTCTANDETLLHLWAKEVLLEEKALRLPEGNWRISSGLVHFQNVEIEKWNKTYGFRPDAEATLENGEILLIEFFVSHKITAKKRKSIADNNLNCIEINLNHVELDKDAIKSFILNDMDYKEWIGVAEEREEIHRKEFSYDGWGGEECNYEKGYNEENSVLQQNWILKEEENWDIDIDIEQSNQIELPPIEDDVQEDAYIYIKPEQRSCFNCKCNLAWENRDGWANCGPYMSLRLPEKRVNPEQARICKAFKPLVITKQAE
jgi:hypothetical protein